MNEQFEVMAGMLSKITYQMAHEEGVSPELSEMLLDFWRWFNVYEEEVGK